VGETFAGKRQPGEQADSSTKGRAEVSWEEAYEASGPSPFMAWHYTAEDACDALVMEVQDRPDLRYVSFADFTEGMDVPVGEVRQHLQAHGVDPTTGWRM
jgi:hypothetical protein